MTRDSFYLITHTNTEFMIQLKRDATFSIGPCFVAKA